MDCWQILGLTAATADCESVRRAYSARRARRARSGPGGDPLTAVRLRLAYEQALHAVRGRTTPTTRRPALRRLGDHLLVLSALVIVAAPALAGRVSPWASMAIGGGILLLGASTSPLSGGGTRPRQRH